MSQSGLSTEPRTVLLTYYHVSILVSCVLFLNTCQFKFTSLESHADMYVLVAIITEEQFLHVEGYVTSRKIVYKVVFWLSSAPASANANLSCMEQHQILPSYLTTATTCKNALYSWQMTFLG